MPPNISKPILFGSFTVTSQVFHTTPHTFAFVNLKPILPGHILISPLRCVPRLKDLTAPEISDLFLTVQKVSRMLERVYSATALNVAVQDGEDAGQSVRHVHAHVIPRRKGDMRETDDVYKEMDGEKGDLAGGFRERDGRGGGLVVDADADRRVRSEEEMGGEARMLAGEMEREVD